MSQDEKLNCWEVKKCGREPEGAKVAELGECPASTENKLHGVGHWKFQFPHALARVSPFPFESSQPDEEFV